MMGFNPKHLKNWVKTQNLVHFLPPAGARGLVILPLLQTCPTLIAGASLFFLKNDRPPISCDLPKKGMMLMLPIHSYSSLLTESCPYSVVSSAPYMSIHPAPEVPNSPALFFKKKRQVAYTRPAEKRDDLLQKYSLTTCSPPIASSAPPHPSAASRSTRLRRKWRG